MYYLYSITKTQTLTPTIMSLSHHTFVYSLINPGSCRIDGNEPTVTINRATGEHSYKNVAERMQLDAEITARVVRNVASLPEGANRYFNVDSLETVKRVLKNAEQDGFTVPTAAKHSTRSVCVAKVDDVYRAVWVSEFAYPYLPEHFTKLV